MSNTLFKVLKYLKRALRFLCFCILSKECAIPIKRVWTLDSYPLSLPFGTFLLTWIPTHTRVPVWIPTHNRLYIFPNRFGSRPTPVWNWIPSHTHLDPIPHPFGSHPTCPLDRMQNFAMEFVIVHRFWKGFRLIHRVQTL